MTATFCSMSVLAFISEFHHCSLTRFHPSSKSMIPMAKSFISAAYISFSSSMSSKEQKVSILLDLITSVIIARWKIDEHNKNCDLGFRTTLIIDSQMHVRFRREHD